MFKVRKKCVVAIVEAIVNDITLVMCPQMDDGFMEVYNALDDVSGQIEGLELSEVHRRIPYDLFRQVIPDSQRNVFLLNVQQHWQLVIKQALLLLKARGMNERSELNFTQKISKREHSESADLSQGESGVHMTSGI